MIYNFYGNVFVYLFCFVFSLLMDVKKNLKKLQPDAILFDMDGVLVDSLDAWWKSLNQALKKFGYNEISRDEFIREYWGHDLFDNIKKMNISMDVGKLCNKLYKMNVDDVKIYPGVKTVLQRLEKYKKSIITNTPKDSAVEILRRLDIKKYFEFVLTSDDVSIAKPSPEIILKSCEILGVKVEDVILVGDTISDVKAGRSAGCRVVGINVDADYTITSVSELTKLIIL